MKKLRTLIIYLIASFSLCIDVFGAEKIIDVEVTGYGSTRELAVNNACINACKQVNGFLFESNASMSSSLVSASSVVNDKDQSLELLNTQTSRQLQEKVNGAIKSYREISSEKGDNGEWKVDLVVQIVRYVTPGIQPDSRRKIVIAPFSILSNSYDIGGQKISASETRNEFREQLEKLLVQSRRFTVLGRNDTDAILAEKQFVIDNANVDEYAKLGCALGTDYLVCGKITDIEVDAGYKKDIFTDTKSPIISDGYIKLSYRIIVMPTGQIKWSDEVKIDLTKNQCKDLKGNVRDAYYLLIKSAAQMVCEQSLGNIYPIRISRLQKNGQVVLGQGGSMYSEGDYFDAYVLGDEIKDIYNNESLGRDESWAATICLTRVEAKLSYAEVVEGEIPEDAIENNLVLCRPVKPSKSVEKKQNNINSSISINSQGGVVLPFDKPKQKSDK